MEFKLMEPRVKLVAITNPADSQYGANAEDLVSYCARVSNPSNQANFSTAQKLLSYCRRNKHWSVFEMSSMVLEIVTTRDIGRQILRHRSFHFQEFSQRYAAATEFMEKEVRLQDAKNRQSSLETSETFLHGWWESVQKRVKDVTGHLYGLALDKGIAKEVSRSILPEGMMVTRMFMHGTIRDWFHYCQLRTSPGTQKEHRLIAEQCQRILYDNFPALQPTTAEKSEAERIMALLVGQGIDPVAAQRAAAAIQYELKG